MEEFLESWIPTVPTFDSTLRLWLWEIVVTSRLPEAVPVSLQCHASTHSQDGIFCLLFCKTETGASVTLVVDDWKPWMRVLSKRSDPVLETLSKASCIHARSGRKMSVLQALKLGPVHKLCEETPKRKLYGWEPDSNLGSRVFPSAQLELGSLFATDAVEQILRSGTMPDETALLETVFAADTLQKPKTRFLHDVGLSPCAWFSVQGLQESDFAKASTQISTACLELKVSKTQLKPDLKCETIPPLRIASFDCEMTSWDGLFPSPFKGDTTFCICTALGLFTPEQPTKCVSIVLGQTMLESTDHHLVVQTASFWELMCAWRHLVRVFDPDIVTGWNTEGFDFEFVANQTMLQFKESQNRLTEPMFLCGMQASNPGKSVPCLADAVRRMNWKEKRELLQTLPSKHHKAAEQFLQVHQKADRASTLEFEEEEEEVDSRLKPEVCASLRETLKLDLHLKWKDDVAASAIASKFGKDAADLVCLPKRVGLVDPLFLSRIASEQCELVTRVLNTAAKGDNVMQKIPMTGRVVLDMMRVIKDDQKPLSNALKFAAENWLGADVGKLDLPTQELFRIWKEKDVEGMSSVIEYCARDAEIPLKLMFKLQYLTSWIGLCRVCFLNPDTIVNGGQQQRVFSLLTRRVKDTHAVNVEDSGWPKTPEYVGATVIDPDAGFFDKPISTLDFASLYPSIMGSNNLCFSTLVTDRSLLPKLVSKSGKPLFQDFVIEHPMQDTVEKRSYAFVTHVRSVLADALNALLSERKAVKKQMEATEDKFLKDVLNKRQLALKVVCNSVYGFTGVDVEKGMLSCKPVAAVTTLIGRRLIQMTREFVEEQFKGARVVYGDTDSVMILWGVETLQEAFALGEDAAGKTTKYLRQKLASFQAESDFDMEDARDIASMVSIVKLEHEKEYWPYLLLKKKNYAGRKWTPKSLQPLVLKDEIDMKGIQAVRRDTVPFVADLSKQILDCLLLDKSAEKALSLVKDTLREVALAKVPLEKFIMSKSIASTYANAASVPHVCAWNRMKERGDEDPPPIGGRMPFVIVHGSSTALMNRCEHPEHVRKAGLKLDTAYYISAASKPIKKLLQFFDDGTLEEVFRDALNCAQSLHTHSLLEFAQTETKEEKTDFVRSPVNAKRRKVAAESFSLEDFC